MTTLNIQIRINDSFIEPDYLASELHMVLASIQCKIAQGQTQNHIYDENGTNIADFKIIKE